MTEDFVLNLARDALYTMLLVSAPILGVSLLTGLVVSIFQATTQIQEPTLTFVPKIAAVFVTILILAAWMLTTLTTFSINLINNMSVLGR